MSALIEEILKFNGKFVENEEYEQYHTTKLPDKKLAVLSCMDTRLTELLPAAMNIKNGDVKIIKNAGALVAHPFGSVMRSILIAIYEQGVEEIAVIGHYDCGMQGLKAEAMIRAMRANGISSGTIAMIRACGIDLDGWLDGFSNSKTSVLETVNIIRNHPLVHKNILVHGFLMDPLTGQLELLDTTC